MLWPIPSKIFNVSGPPVASLQNLRRQVDLIHFGLGNSSLMQVYTCLLQSLLCKRRYIWTSFFIPLQLWEFLVMKFGSWACGVGHNVQIPVWLEFHITYKFTWWIEVFFVTEVIKNGCIRSVITCHPPVLTKLNFQIKISLHTKKHDNISM